ncbi:MAG: hypothetical protein LBJ94_01045 [Puniceicoccales bacterium]|jgi:hypothetical protein|nr:hypothetical protein [Puniceicoccales bacterium]
MKKIINIMMMAIVLACTGCSSIGPKGMRSVHPQYNDALTSVLDRQLLNNLVRLKYRENPLFLEINSITESRTRGLDGGLGNGKWFLHQSASQSTLVPTFKFLDSQTPTISYHPLRGKEFIQHLMTPIPFSAVLLMSQSGWKLERVFDLCIEKINGVDNASNASGPTPRIKPDYEKFYRMTSLLQKLEYEHKLALGLDSANKSLVLRFINVSNSPDMKELRKILDLEEGRDEFYFQDNFLSVSKQSLSVRMRSLMGLLFYLSHTVEVPQEDIDSGKVMTTVDGDGKVFDWTKNASGKMLNIKCSKVLPKNAFIATYHRGHWFYIADEDLHSKSTFMFVSYLFNLQAGEASARSVAPLLTIPTTSAK